MSVEVAGGDAMAGAVAVLTSDAVAGTGRFFASSFVVAPVGTTDDDSEEAELDVVAKATDGVSGVEDGVVSFNSSSADIVVHSIWTNN